MDDMLRNEKEGKISCFLTAEDGNGINGTLAGLEKMYKMGIRLISITWNHENCPAIQIPLTRKRWHCRLNPLAVR